MPTAEGWSKAMAMPCTAAMAMKATPVFTKAVPRLEMAYKVSPKMKVALRPKASAKLPAGSRRAPCARDKTALGHCTSDSESPSCFAIVTIATASVPETTMGKKVTLLMTTTHSQADDVDGLSLKERARRCAASREDGERLDDPCCRGGVATVPSDLGRGMAMSGKMRVRPGCTKRQQV